MRFRIEQIAVTPRDPVAAKELLTAIGAADWVEDHVVAEGNVFGKPGANEAELSFAYNLGNEGKPLEFEVLNYTEGRNWVEDRPNTVSHLGMHCSAEELIEWRAFFTDRGIPVAQEVFTQSHSNAAIAGKRWYNYVIFDTLRILGVDLKFIVRRSEPGSYAPR